MKTTQYTTFIGSSSIGVTNKTWRYGGNIGHFLVYSLASVLRVKKPEITPLRTSPFLGTVASISQYTLEKLNGFKFPVTDRTKRDRGVVCYKNENKSWNMQQVLKYLFVPQT